jgi:hypothetical protein
MNQWLQQPTPYGLKYQQEEHKLAKHTFTKYLAIENLKANFSKRHEDVLDEIEKILGSECFPADLLAVSTNEDPWDTYWLKTESSLIKLLDNIRINDRLAIDELSKLINATKNYVNGSDYINPGRFVKTSNLFYSIVKSSPAFNRFNQSLNDYLSRIISLVNTNEQQHSSIQINLMGCLSKVISYIRNNPVKSMLLIAQTQVLLAAAQPRMPEPIASWDLHGNPLDSTGRGNDGVAHGVISTDGMRGQPNTAYFFDGKSWIDGWAGGLPDLGRTVSIYFMLGQNKIDGKNHPGGMFFGYGGNGQCGTSFEIIINNARNSPDNSYQVQAHCNNESFEGDDPKMAASSEWHHLLVTSDGNGDSRMYLDGEPLVTTGTFLGRTTVVKDAKFAIGALSDLSGKTPFSTDVVPMFIGKMANITMYDEVLHEEQAKYLASFLPIQFDKLPPKQEQHESDLKWWLWEFVLTLPGLAFGLAAGWGGEELDARFDVIKEVIDKTCKSTACIKRMLTILHRQGNGYQPILGNDPQEENQDKPRGGGKEVEIEEGKEDRATDSLRQRPQPPGYGTTGTSRPTTLQGQTEEFELKEVAVDVNGNRARAVTEHGQYHFDEERKDKTTQSLSPKKR